ncbi:MAG: hypothetical protein ACPGUI_00365 [Halarcobacter sp.]
MKFLALILITVIALFSKDLQIQNEQITLDAKIREMMFINLPFKPKLEDVKVLGQKNAFVAEATNKTLSFHIKSFPLSIVIFGGEYPLYITFKDIGEKPLKDKIFNFYKTKDDKKGHYLLGELDNDIKEIFSQIDENNNLELDNFYKVLINTKSINQDEYLEHEIVESFENEKYIIEKRVITNTHEKKIFSFKQKRHVFKYPHLLAFTPSNLYIAPMKSVTVYFAYDKTREL